MAAIPPSFITEVEFSFDGSSIATVAAGGGHIWRIADLKETPLESQRQLSFQSVAWSPDGSRIATGSYQGVLQVWDAATGKLLESWPGHDGAIDEIRFSADGNVIASEAKDILVWGQDPKAYQRIVASQPTSFSRLAGLSEGRVVSWVEQGPASVRDSLTGQTLSAIQIDNNSSIGAAAAQANIFVTSNPNAAKIRLHSLEPKTSTRTLPVDSQHISQLALAHDGKTLAVAAGTIMDGKLMLLDTDTLQIKHRLPGHPMVLFNAMREPLRVDPRRFGAISAMVFSTDGQFLASASFGRIRLWDTATGQLLHETTQHQRDEHIHALAFSPDSTKLAATDITGHVRFWNVASGEPLGSLDGIRGKVLAYSHDGQTLVTGGDNGRLQLWHLPTLEASLVFSSLGNGGFESVVFTEKDRVLVAGAHDGSIEFFRADPRPPKAAEPQD